MGSVHGSLVIGARFCGPPDSGNGGVSAGLLASHIDGPAEVTLRHPPPLDRTLSVEHRGDAVALLDGDALIAEAMPAAVELDLPDPVDWAAADAATARCAVLVHRDWHAFPTCFVCGYERAPGDGLRVFPGPVAGTDMVAAPVAFPHDLGDDNGLVRSEIVWAALDCPSAFVMYDRDTTERPAPHVLGRIAARIDRRPASDEQVVAMAWPLGRDGRKLFSASALFDGAGRVLAAARATWIRL